jgi:hypothetical protein
MTIRPCGESGTDSNLELQRVWFEAQALEWRALALVPASHEVPVVRLADAFAALGLRDRGESIGVADLRDVPVQNLRGPMEVIRWHVRRGERVILALSPCSRNAVTLPLVRVADCAILCVALGTTRIAEVEETVEQMGDDAIVGTVLVRPELATGRNLATRARAFLSTRMKR